jgi:2-haloacid dehalogenase
MTRQYQWLLFDADGTLFDFATAEARALEQAFVDMGAPFTSDCLPQYQRINAKLWAMLERGEVTPGELQVQRFALLCETLGLKVAPDVFSSTYLACLSGCGDVIEGALEVVAALSQAYQLALVTNGLSRVQRGRLSGSPLEPFFSHLIISEEVGVAKPAREYFEVVFERIGFDDRRAVLLIGDSLSSDMQGGRNSGIDTCWYNPARLSRPEGMVISYEIHDLRQLLSLLL